MTQTDLEHLLEVPRGKLLHASDVGAEASNDRVLASWDHRISIQCCQPPAGTKHDMAYRSSRNWHASPPAAMRICTRWVKVPFHTPSSNSCMRSGTKSSYTLRPNDAKRSDHADCTMIGSIIL